MEVCTEPIIEIDPTYLRIPESGYEPVTDDSDSESYMSLSTSIGAEMEIELSMSTEFFNKQALVPVQTQKQTEYWCRDRNVMRGKRLCSFILFALKDHLNIDCISNIIPIIYDYVLGYGGKVSTVGGKRNSPKKVLDGPLENAEFDNPFGIHFDRNDNLLVSEFGSHTIRLISPQDNTVTTIAGKAHEKGNEDGDGTNTAFWIPVQFCEDRDGNYIVVDSFNNNYRRISLVDGVYKVKTIELGLDSSSEFPNEVNACHDIFLDHQGNLVGSDTCNHRIIKLVNNDEFVDYSGVYGTPGHKDGPIKEALWNKPSGLVVDRHGDIIVCDYQNHCIRKIHTKTNMVTTIAGQGGKEGFKDGPANECLFRHPNAICLGLDDDLIVADTDNFCIRLISNGSVRTLAGTTKLGSEDGNALESSFNFPVNLCIDYRGDIFIADWKNNLIRKFSYDY